MSPTTTELAPGVHCIGPSGRAQTNVYLVRSGSSWALVDAGWASDAERIETATAAVLGPDERPAAILLTHCHPDHAGSARVLAERWECPVWMHPDEVPIATGDFAEMVRQAGPLDRWVILPIMRAMGARRREAVLARESLGDIVRAFTPGGEVPGLPDWTVVHTPGHTPGHVSFLRPGDRVMITGDALLTLQVNSLAGLLWQRQGLSGPPWYTTWNRQVAEESIATIAASEPTVIAPGHGHPLTGAATAAAIADMRRAAKR